MDVDLTSLFSAENLIAAASFVIVVVLVFVIARQLLRLQRDPVRERLGELAREQASSGRSPLMETMVESLASQVPQTRLDDGRLARELCRAGYYRPTASTEFLAVRNGLMILAIVISGTAAVALGPERQQAAIWVFVAGLVTAVVIWAGPRAYLQALGNRRVERISRGLPDALDMITMCVTGGISLRDAITRVSGEIFSVHPDLAIELLIVRRQADVTTLGTAFDQFAQRVDLPETISMASLISEGQRLGVDLVESIREFADNMRLKRRQLADERANRVTVTVMFPVVLCLLPAVLLYLWGPAIVDVYEFLQTWEGASAITELLEESQ